MDDLISAFAHKFGFDRITVFRDFLRYTINGWTLPDYPSLSDWSYSPEQNAMFGEMYKAWILIMDEQLKNKEFFDCFARLHPAYSSDADKKSKGQFMTPPHICQLMATIALPDTSSEVNKVCDPTGGSGGLLLASHAHSPRNFHVSMDVDYTMCLQAVCNFIIHGVVGVVVCKNTLTLTNFQGAWLVNEFLHRAGVPTVRPLTEEECETIIASDRVWIYFLDQEGYDQFELGLALLSQIHDIIKD